MAVYFTGANNVRTTLHSTVLGKFWLSINIISNTAIFLPFRVIGAASCGNCCCRCDQDAPSSHAFGIAPNKRPMTCAPYPDTTHTLTTFSTQNFTVSPKPLAVISLTGNNFACPYVASTVLMGLAPPGTPQGNEWLAFSSNSACEALRNMPIATVTSISRAQAFYRRSAYTPTANSYMQQHVRSGYDLTVTD